MRWNYIQTSMIRKRKGLVIRIEPIATVPGCQVFYLDGYIDSSNVMWFQKLILRSIGKGANKLIFSLERFNFVSEDIIGCLIVFLRAAKSLGGDIVVIGIPPKIWEVFQLLGFALFFNFRKDIDQAQAYFTQGGPFPKIFRCAMCKEWLEANQQGVIKCSGCKAVFSININGEVLEGAAIDYNADKN